MSPDELREKLASFGVVDIDEGDFVWLVNYATDPKQKAHQDKKSVDAVRDLGDAMLRMVSAFKAVEAAAQPTTSRNGAVNVASQFADEFAPKRDAFADSMAAMSQAVIVALDTGIPRGRGRPPLQIYDEYLAGMIACCRCHTMTATTLIDVFFACQGILPAWAKARNREEAAERYKQFRETKMHALASQDYPIAEWLTGILN